MDRSEVKIYLASALFSHAEYVYNWKLYEGLTSLGYEVYLPQIICHGIDDPHQIFQTCLDHLLDSDIVVANFEGTDVDSGTAWECGCAYASKIPVIGVRTDFRTRGDDGGLNCMLSRSAAHLLNLSYDMGVYSICAAIDEAIDLLMDVDNV